MTFDGAVDAHGGPPRRHSGDPKATDMNGLARSVKTKTLAASAHFFFPRFSGSLQEGRVTGLPYSIQGGSMTKAKA
eukprot:scaffold6248_cov121-Isochrysis_galbana.AAC.1